MAGTAFEAGGVAVITGAALGIGRATAKRLAGLGMKVCLVDLASDDLEAAASEVAALAGSENVLVAPTDVADWPAMSALAGRVHGTLGPVSVLMNNAVTRAGGRGRETGFGIWGDMDEWRRAVDVNLMGVTHGVRAFVPAMIERGRDGGAPGVVINVGSKQGITNPPGNAVYNLCKAAVKSYTETLRHALRSDGAAVSAHLLIPGWTTTGKAEHKPGAWLPDRVVELMLSSIDRGDFYILCPDGEVTPEMDHKRVLWGARDIVDNRPPLSRWHGGFGDAYEAFET